MIQYKTFLLTGAANGIGRKLAEGLAQKGARLLLVDIDLEGLHQAFSESDTLLLRQLDVTQEADWERVLQETVERFGQLDYCVNNAGVIMPGFLTETPLEHIDFHLNVNAKGVMLGTMLAARMMVLQGQGHIINIASLAGIAPIQGISLYSASKFAVRGFGIAAHYELAAQGIHVSVICPDLVDTAMLTTQLQYPEESAMSFSGAAQALQVEDVERAFYRVLQKRPIEYCLPRSRGWLAKVGNAFPGLGALLVKRLQRKGLRRAREWGA
ncbi:MAG: SDR family oxidoreductase [Bacteroidota bacterium]